MKNVKLLALSLMAGGLLLAANPSQAQFNPAANPDMDMPDPWGNHIHPTVRNTGNDVFEAHGKEMRVMTWDGDNPSFGWDWGYGGVVGSQLIEGVNYGKVSDPDIVLDRHGKGMIGITYILDHGKGPQVWAEVWEFNGSNFNLVMPPKQVDNGKGKYCSNPNIDIDFGYSEAVITYEQDGQIFAHPLDITSAYLTGNIFHVSKCLDGKKLQPDVAIFSDPQGSGKSIVSFTYIMDDGSTKYLVVQQEDINDVLYTPASNCKTIFFPVKVKSGYVLEYPRIAAPVQNLGFNLHDMQVVVRKNDSGSDQILGVTHRALVYGLGNLAVHIINDIHGIEKCENTRPVVTYIGDFIIASWTYEDLKCGILNKNKDVLVRHLSISGQPMFPTYSIVNKDMDKDQRVISISGRHSNYRETFYTFYNEHVELIQYKSSLFINQHLRKGELQPGAAAQLNVYPVPVTAAATIEYSIGKGETAVALELYSLTGQKVRSFQVAGQTEGKHTVTFSEAANGAVIAPGVYLLRMSTDKATQAVRVVVE